MDVLTVVVGTVVGVVTTVVGGVVGEVAIVGVVVGVGACVLLGVVVVGIGAVEEGGGPVAWVVATLKLVEGVPIASRPPADRARGKIEPLSSARTAEAAAAVPTTVVAIRRLRSVAARR